MKPPFPPLKAASHLTPSLSSRLSFSPYTSRELIMDPASQSDPIQSTEEDYVELPYFNLTDAELSAIEAETRQVADRVRELYANGVPFFTRSAIQDLVHQIDRATQRFQDEGPAGICGQTFSLQGLDGKTVEVDIEIGKTVRLRGTRELVFGLASKDPFLNYQTYQHLTSCHSEPSSFSPELAYCPLYILHHSSLRDITTGQIIHDYKYEPLESVQRAFDTISQTWADGEDCRRLKSALAAVSIPKTITKIVAFACSTMSISNGIGQRSSIIQHALMLTIRDFLQGRNDQPGVEITCYAQDPQYTEEDAAVLQNAGITVIGDPRGFLEVDDSSVVMSFAADIPVRQIVADLARPAILIWDQVKGEEETLRDWSGRIPGKTWETLEELEGMMGDPDSPRLREIIRKEYVEMGGLLDENVFGQSTIHIRRS
ncbi:hypothetical protein VM1G_08043 [Cytospora mali]|uniref:SRR1-like domain-containing protein n=1 Tax=Cytospora mali TaxID=578113 RepID=A0A194W8C6_CYTMA|nr:hypothetical protein VM1G_08043 [Valsa mali]